jgi:hypothetical protein
MNHSFLHSSWGEKCQDTHAVFERAEYIGLVKFSFGKHIGALRGERLAMPCHALSEEIPDHDCNERLVKL